MSELGRNRHRARERALEIFYESAIKERPVAVIVTELNTRPDEYTLSLLTSAESHQPRANELISEFSIDWPLERIALVDRLIMTLAVGEMLSRWPGTIVAVSHDRSFVDILRPTHCLHLPTERFTHWRDEYLDEVALR